MDQDRFDRLARVLGKPASRRASVLGAIGTALGLVAAPAADAARKATRRHEKLACRNANSQCISDDECCSGSCVPKFGGTEFRCAKRHAKKDKKKKDGNGPAPLACTVCASGCPFTTIQDALAAADSYSTITIAPGMYYPNADSPNTRGSFEIDINVALVACDPNDRPVVNDGINPNVKTMFYIGRRDGENTCVDQNFSAIFDGIVMVGSASTGHGAVWGDCTASFIIENSDIQGFGPTYMDSKLMYAPVLYTAYATSEINNSTIRNCGTISSYGPTAIQVFLPEDRQVNNYLHLNDTEVFNNSGLSHAIGIGAYGTMFLSGSSTVHGNTATSSNGGGIYIEGSYSELFIEDEASVYDNTCSGYGGGIYAGSTALVNGHTVTNVHNNTAGNSCNNFYVNGTGCVIS